MTHEIRLRSGRLLEFMEYGDPGGHPTLFFHGLIGSHHQASYISEQARQAGLRIIAPNRPGVGRSGFIERRQAIESAGDTQELVESLGLSRFSLIGISGGTPYALSALLRLGERVRTVTLISGMGPIRLPGALRGMDRRRRMFLLVGSRSMRTARRAFQRAGDRYHADPERFLRGLVSTWSEPDQALFRHRPTFDLFLQDLREVFSMGRGAESLAHELRLYRHYGFDLAGLPASRTVTIWQGLDDTIVPPAMAWALTQRLPNRETHFVPGGHFVALKVADRIIARLREQLDRDGLR
jgi:pimeloyl-ACP methyl ester carboxylesterase